MSRRGETTRLRQLQGGWALTQDFRDQPDLPDTRLSEHHIAAHRTWGCSAGLAVMVEDGDLVVTRGCAVDRCGRTAILQRIHRSRMPDRPVAVVLTVVGGGPTARVRLREPGDVLEADIPLASLDENGVVHAGDGHRRWLRRPGPTLLLGGVVPRGFPVSGGSSLWQTRVDLSRYRLPDTPVVVATVAGPTPADSAQVLPDPDGLWAPQATAITLLIQDPTPGGFTIRVRTHFDDAFLPPGITPFSAKPARIRTAPFALAWTAVVPAERPEFPPTEEWR